MATATRVQHKAKAQRRTEVHGQFVAQRQEGGAWVTVIEEEYANDHHRANLHRAYSEWVNNAPAGDVRRCVEHCTVDGKPRHIIRGENQPRKPADGGWEQEEHDAAALRQFLADATGLKWRVESGMHGQRAVDLAETPAPMSGWQREYTRNGATYDAPNL